MKKIEINGMGVFTEIYRRNDRLSEIETIKEAIKSLQREVIIRENKINKK